MTAGARGRVALVHDWLTGMRGGEKVLEAIARLFPTAPIFTLFHFPGSVSAEIESHPVRTSFLQRAPFLRRHYRWYLPLFPAAVERLDVGDFDLVVSTSHCAAKSVIPRPGARHICYCHTPMRYAWDQELAYFPDRSGPVGRLRSAILARLRRWDAATAHRVDHFLANSTFVAERIELYYGREAQVVHPPVDTEFFTLGDGTREDFALFVAAPAPYKRLPTAIEACRRQGIELKVVGDAGATAAAGPGVRLLGRVGDEELRHLYRTARFLVQPGVEDFGITAVEALACGCPVVALGRGGVTDIVEDGIHGVLFEGEADAEQLSAAIDKLRGLGLNSHVLRRRAESFSARRFEREIEVALAAD